MASTSVTTIGELMVITQVIPRDASFISLQTPGNTEQQAPPPEVKAPPTSFKAAIKKDTFARREPQGLGVRVRFSGRVSGRSGSFKIVEQLTMLIIKESFILKFICFIICVSSCLQVVQIFIGLLSVLFSLTPLLSPLLIHYAPFGVGLFVRRTSILDPCGPYLTRVGRV